MARNNNNPTGPAREFRPASWMILLALCALGGCVDRSVLVDRKALAGGGKYIVLPLADAPGERADGSGKVVTGSITAELLKNPKIRLFDVGQSKLTQALASTGYHALDMNDPVVAAELGRKLEAGFVVTGEVIHYALEKQAVSSSVSIFRGGGTKTRHWVCLHVRIVRASDGKIIYAGDGSACSLEGYAAAAEQACEKAFQELENILEGKERFGWSGQ